MGMLAIRGFQVQIYVSPYSIGNDETRIRWLVPILLSTITDSRTQRIEKT